MSALYWKVFYFAFTPVRLVASVLWRAEWIPLGPLTSYVFGAAICRWPQRAEPPQ